MNTALICYEFPLIERVRILLRLEKLFARVDYFLEGNTPADHHATLLPLFEIYEITGRADLKSDLLQELERQKQTLLGLRDNPAIDNGALEQVLTEIEEAASTLYGMLGKIGSHLRDNEWIMNLKQRLNLPGGASEFDIPAYYYWQNQSLATRLNDLQHWYNPFLPLRNALALILRMLRESEKTQRYQARGGVFQQMLGGQQFQLLRLHLARELPCVPEFSANKYAINLRFTTASTTETKPKVYDHNLDFQLTYCAL